MSDCIVCASALPQLGTMPFPLNPLNDPSGYNCMIQLYLKQTVQNCTSLSLLYPEVNRGTTPPPFVPYPGPYSCVHRSDEKGIMVGSLTSCGTINKGINQTTIKALGKMQTPTSGGFVEKRLCIQPCR